MTQEKNHFRGKTLYFPLLLALQVFFFGFIIRHRLMPAGHDGFQYFHLQYYFLNNAVTAREFALWSPFMTHGVVLPWWVSVQAGWLQNVLCLLSVLAGPVLKGINFLVLFDLGILADVLILLTGTWLLARKLFGRDLTAFVVTATVTGSCVWMIQPWYNFHFYYALPLILYFGHLFLETGRWRHFFLAGSLTVSQIMGNLPYMLTVTTLVVFLYFLFYALFNRDKIARFTARDVFSVRALAAVLGVAAFWFLAGGTLFWNTSEIVNYNYDRLLSGTTSLKGFLMYGRNMGLKKWAELLLGVSPILDITLYVGALPLVLIPLGFAFREARKNWHLPLLIAVLGLFSAGTVVARALYYVWPFMKYYRHLGLVAPVIKFFLCLWAGCGFEALLEVVRDPDRRPALRQGLLFVSGLLLVLSLCLFVLARRQIVLEKLIPMLGEASTVQVNADTGEWEFLPGIEEFYDPALLPRQVFFAALTALLTSLLGMGLAVCPRNGSAGTLLFLIVFLHVTGLQRYKFSQLRQKTIPVEKPLLSVTRFQPMPFVRRRALTFTNDTPRTELMNRLTIFTQYWSVYTFLFKDEIGHSYRTDYWLRPFNDYMKAYWGQSLDNEREKVPGLIHYVALEFPLSHPAAGKIAGATADKIQFFRKAFAVASKSETAQLMRDPDYAGDFIFIAPGPKPPAPPWTAGRTLSENTRVDLDYQVRRFDANHLVVTVDVPGPGPLWMLYSDVWHPSWRATVNGNPVPVARANLAYKAVRLSPGKDTVHFFYRDRLLDGLYAFWGVASLAGLGIVLGHIIGIVRGEGTASLEEEDS